MLTKNICVSEIAMRRPFDILSWNLWTSFCAVSPVSNADLIVVGEN